MNDIKNPISFLRNVEQINVPSLTYGIFRFGVILRNYRSEHQG